MFLRLLIVYGLLSWQPSLATEMKQLYKTEVIAFSQEPEDRRAALEEALTTVLQRILPNTLINSNDPRITKALHNAESFIKNEYSSDVNAVYSGDTLARTLHVEFDGWLATLYSATTADHFARKTSRDLSVVNH